MTNKRDLKAFVRFDGSGRLIPSSVIFRKNKPKVGNWVEISAYECCGPTTTTLPTCVTYEIVITEGEEVTLTYNNCDGTAAGPFSYTGPVDDFFCAAYGSPSVRGIATLTLYMIGCISTTTTTTQNPQ